jgi:hypothetical protein
VNKREFDAAKPLLRIGESGIETVENLFGVIARRPQTDAAISIEILHFVQDDPKTGSDCRGLRPRNDGHTMLDHKDCRGLCPRSDGELDSINTLVSGISNGAKQQNGWK